MKEGDLFGELGHMIFCFTLTVREEAFFIQRAAANIKEDCNYYTKILEDIF